MVKNNVDKEIEAIAIMDKALSQLDPEARERVFNWAIAKYGNPKMGSAGHPFLGFSLNKKTNAMNLGFMKEEEKEIKGVALLTETGDFRILVRDLKGKSANDSAIRLAHIVLYSYEQLTGNKYISSSKVLNSILKEYRLYDGNTRSYLARYKGIHRDKDKLFLDAHSRFDAEMFIKDVLDDSIKGKWAPKSSPQKKAIRGNLKKGQLNGP